MESKTKLTPAQAKVIRLLQKGEVITHNDRNYFVSDGFKSHKIQWRVWYALTQTDKQVWDRDEPLILQQSHYPFDFVLTKKGKEIKL